MSSPRADIAVIGGSGLYTLLEDAESVTLSTPHGDPSGPITLGSSGGRRVAFLPRHGARHTLPPHGINYRANIWALHSLGVERILAPCAVGSLRAEHSPGTVVVCDQFIDRTSGRADTFFDGPEVAHVSTADPYCDELGRIAAPALGRAGLEVHPGGTVIVIQGPRFSSRAESRWFASMGGDVVNMTQYPEVALARELGMCYCALALVTDYDAGLAGRDDVEAVTQAAVMARFGENVERLRAGLRALVGEVPVSRTCDCAAGAPGPMGGA